MTQVARITVVGAGFGGLSAIRELRKRDESLEVAASGKIRWGRREDD